MRGYTYLPSRVKTVVEVVERKVQDAGTEWTTGILLERGYVPYVLLPATVALFLLWGYARRSYPRLANRIGAGLAAGFIAALGLDAVRLIGVKLGAFPGDMPTMMGQMITGLMGKSAFVLLAGYIYHLLFNGSTFGLMYTLLAGKARWGWGVAWGLFFELGMMTMPPVATMTGPFGIFGFWPRLFIASLLAHIAFGVVLGLLAERWVRDRGTIFSLLREEPKRPELTRVA